MPRRNKHKTNPQAHAPSLFSHDIKSKCRGCAFAGHGAVCLTSDGTCLKVPEDAKEGGNALAGRMADTASPQC